VVSELARRHGVLPWILIAGTGLAVLGVIAFAALHGVAFASPSASPSTVTIATAGQSWQLAKHGGLELGPDQLMAESVISGTFSTTTGVIAYLVPQSAIGAFVHSGPPSSYAWTSGTVQSGSVSVDVAAGSYYLLFQNPSPTAPTSVYVTQTITATYSS
jgi:hypothetical protein